VGKTQETKTKFVSLVAVCVFLTKHGFRVDLPSAAMLKRHFRSGCCPCFCRNKVLFFFRRTVAFRLFPELFLNARLL